MSKIVFFCIPAQGHTNPTLGVVRELVSRGHEVWYYSYEPLRSGIEAAGARFVACDAYDHEQKLSPADGARLGKDLAFSTRVLVDTTLALDGPVCRRMEELQPDCIVGDSMAVWAKVIAGKLGIPFVSSTTTFAFNRYSARIMGHGVGECLSMLLSMGRANREIRRLREAGYPIRNALELIQNDDDVHTIVYTSPEFQPCAETFSERYAFVGPSIRPVETPFHKKKAPLIYVSMGTVNNDLMPLYRSCVEGFRALDAQVVLSVGEQVDVSMFGSLPEHMEVYPRVDQIAVLEQADVFLTHCGMNSVSEGLYFGVPLVLLPQTPEQGGVANRVEELGAGLRLTEQTPTAIAGAVQQVLCDPCYRNHAAEISAGFRRCPGAPGAADKILSQCRG